ncbi:histidine phosphatase family protein [Nocardioides aquiterrae]|uniref:Histidine phosphatase family protein n=2 Tax=Nocardioides aquiterrae TaxID=203799 RepID=A0ABN1UP45_9ACTN
MRHAKAEQGGRTDFERELTDRGRADAAEAGAWLAGRGFAPQHALVSAAARTRATWEALAAGGGWELEPDYDRGLYVAEPATAVDLIGLVDDDVRTLVVIGHNPTMAYLAQLLGDGEGDPELESQLLAGFPTSATAVFEYDGAWSDLAEGSARLVGYHVGRG